MIVIKNQQLEFKDIPFGEFLYKEDHPLIQLEKAINWKNLLDFLSQFYSPDQGRPTTPLRAQVGTEIIKRFYNMSDRTAVRYVEESMYAQKFCQLHPSEVTGYMNPDNGLSNFRKKIGKEGLAFIEEVLQASARKKPLKKGGKPIVDTTCVLADIIYPTDIRLLERCRQEIIRLIKKAQKLGLKVIYRTYNRTARKIFVRFSKLSRPKEKIRRKVHKRMIQFVSRNFKQLCDLRRKACQFFANVVKNDPQVLAFLRKLKEAERKIRVILHQQKQIYRGILHIPERIVSFHKDYVRPIIRGKLPVNTEFGSKVLLAVVNGYTYVVDIFRTNVADVNLILPALRWFKKTFGHLPSSILGDRGFFSRWLKRILEKFSIRSGLQERGKVVNSSISGRRARRQRSLIESRISLAKRKFGWDRCRAKNPEHEEYWIRLQAAAMNVHLVFSCKPP